jgi:hypothetical protein
LKQIGDDEPEYPEQVVSEDQRVRMNYYYLKNQIYLTPIVPMQQDSFENILRMVQDSYIDNKEMNRVVNDIFDETKTMYHESMQKSIIRNTLRKPNVKGLEDENYEQNILNMEPK